MGSLALVVSASLLGTLSRGLVLGWGIACLAAAAALWPRRSRAGVPEGDAPAPIAWAALVLVGLLALRWVLFWRSALVVEPDGLWAGSVGIWQDWSQHLGDVTAFAYGDNFPPAHPRFAGAPYAYHYLTSVTVAAMVRLGLDPVRALPLHSCVLSLLVSLGIYALTRRLTGRSGDGRRSCESPGQGARLLVPRLLYPGRRASRPGLGARRAGGAHAGRRCAGHDGAVGRARAFQPDAWPRPSPPPHDRGASPGRLDPCPDPEPGSARDRLATQSPDHAADRASSGARLSGMDVEPGTGLPAQGASARAIFALGEDVPRFCSGSMEWITS
jgi:hypothetical protein